MGGIVNTGCRGWNFHVGSLEEDQRGDSWIVVEEDIKLVMVRWMWVIHCGDPCMGQPKRKKRRTQNSISELYVRKSIVNVRWFECSHRATLWWTELHSYKVKYHFAPLIHFVISSRPPLFVHQLDHSTTAALEFRRRGQPILSVKGKKTCLSALQFRFAVQFHVFSLYNILTCT